MKEPANPNVLESRSRTTETERRNVQTQEQLGGHTIERHVGKSANWLRNRLETDPSLRDTDYASSFRNETIANRAQGRFVKRFKLEVESRIKNGEGKLAIDFDMGEIVGNVVERGKAGEILTSKVRVVIVKDASVPEGWRILSSFPIPK